VEEDGDFRSGSEFPDELLEDNGNHVADLVEENAYSRGSGDWESSKRLCQLCFASRVGDEQVRGWETILGFGSPLLFLAKAPEDKDGGEEEGEEESEPL
jgi:hypothetical protein